MGPHVPATHTLEQNTAEPHAWRHTPARNTHAGHPQSQTPLSPGSTGVCARTQSTGSSQRGGTKLLPGNSPPRKLCAQGTRDPVFTPRAPGAVSRGCVCRAPGTLCSPWGLQGQWAGAACAGHQGPCVHPGGFRGGGRAGGRFLHVTSGGLLFKCHQAPPCSEPAMAPITGAKPVSCSGSRPGVIGPVVLSPNLQTQPPPPWLSDRPQGLCACCFHCLFPLFSLMRICMICSHSSFHHRAWMRLPFLPPAPPTSSFPRGPPSTYSAVLLQSSASQPAHTDVCICLLSVSLLACQLHRGLVPHRALSPGLRAGPTHSSAQCMLWTSESWPISFLLPSLLSPAPHE